MTLLLVSIGSGVGGVLRFLLGSAVTARTGRAWPWGTLVVNFSGCFVIGLVFGLWGAGPMVQTAPSLQQAAAYGLLGGYTTFSAYSTEAVALLKTGRLVQAIAYVIGTLAVCIVAVLLGAACVSG